MPKYGSPDFKVEVDGTDTTGGNLVDLSAYVDTVNELNIEAMLQEGHGFGKSWVEQLYTGMKKGNDLTLEGFYDDTATTGPHAVLNSLGSSRQVKLTWGGSKTSTFAVVIKNYVRKPVRGELTRFSCTLSPSGEVTEA